MCNLENFLGENSGYLILALCVFSLLLLIFCIALYSKISKLTKKSNVKLEEGKVEDIVNSLTNHSDQLLQIEDSIKKIASNQDKLEVELAKCMQKVGIVKFNAFEDVGGDQSFSLAITDSGRNGIIISNLYGRQDSRLYVKLINNGKSERELSDEEKKALESAMS